MSYNILYVDDEESNLTVFATKFKRSFNVFTAQSAQDGLRVMQEKEIHIIISDQRMPEMTGVQLLEQVRKDYPETIRIILTGYTEPQDIIDAVNRGGIYYFVRKPWDSEELKALISKSLSFYNLRLRNKELLKRLFVTINELETFYYRAAHDIRGPLATQLGLIFLARAENEFSKVEPYLDMLESSIRKLDTTLTKIDALSNVDQSPSLLASDAFHQMINETMDVLQEEILVKGIQITVSVAENISIHAGYNQLKSLFENMLENSIHFSDGDKETRTIDVHVEGTDAIQIKVKDNGIGIDQSKVDNIFDAFFRGSEMSKGNGLGLYIVRKTVAVLQGTIEVDSSPSVGTTITIQLPQGVNKIEGTIQGATTPFS